MYRAILCDDDEIIARGMSMCIPWEELGIEFCGYRNNGLEGKRLFDEVKPDIVMTDICMPLMDGLQLTEYAKSVNPDVRVIIFSGYGDFKYAQKAIHVGAMDYLLKPINETELRELLRRAVEELNRVREHSIYERDREQRNMTDLLRTLMFDGPAAAMLRGSAAILDELKSDCVMAFIANIDSYNQLHYRMTNEEILNVNTNFASCFEKQLSEFIILDRNYGELIGCVRGSSRDEINLNLRKGITHVRNTFRILCPELSLTFVCGGIYPSIEELHRSYQEAEITTQSRFVHPAGSCIRYSPADNEVELSDDDMDKLYAVSKVLAAVKQCDRTRIDMEIESLRALLLKAGMRSRTLLQFYTNNLFNTLFINLQQMGLDDKASELDFIGEYERIGSLQNVDVALDRLRAILNKVVMLLEENSRSRNSLAIADAIEYINEHYMDHRLSLDDVAKHVHMSPCYFSVIFKRETCDVFTDYLIRLRIKKSIEMMHNTDMKVYEIAIAVGYDTASYYSTAFKKETGYSPREYKKIFVEAEAKD